MCFYDRIQQKVFHTEIREITMHKHITTRLAQCYTAVVSITDMIFGFIKVLGAIYNIASTAKFQDLNSNIFD